MFITLHFNPPNFKNPDPVYYIAATFQIEGIFGVRYVSVTPTRHQSCGYIQTVLFPPLLNLNIDHIHVPFCLYMRLDGVFS